jgi:hypothetical protein
MKARTRHWLRNRLAGRGRTYRPGGAHRIDVLLTSGPLSGAQKEQVLRGILGASAPARRAHRVAWFLPVAAVAGFLLLWRASTAPTVETGVFRPRGGPAGGPLVTVGCHTTCRRGAVLLFRIDGVPVGRYLAAYAEAPDGRRIWYFPDHDGSQPRLPPGDGPLALSRGILLGEAHTPGHYRVHLAFTLAPLSREDLRRSWSRLPHTVTHFEVRP